MDYVAQQAVDFYDNHRPHQSKGNEPLRFPGEHAKKQSATGHVECPKILGGLLKHYYRKAA
jgi:hypothetical protein